MYSKVIAVDLAKDVYQVALSNPSGRIFENLRLTRPQFERFVARHEPATFVIEACGSAHHWGRFASSHNHTVRMLPAQFVKPYRLRNKTDKADSEALVDAHRSCRIKSVPVSTVEQQQVLQVHALREQWKKTRVQRINGLRGCLRELGHFIPVGAHNISKHVHQVLSEADLPAALAHLYHSLLVEIAELHEKIKQAEATLKQFARSDDRVQRLQQIPGIGVMTSTALVASVGNPHRFPKGRHLASWLGLTPKENSSGKRRKLGGISKQGNCYLRMLLTHGARSVLARAKHLQRTEQPLNSLQRWAVTLERRVGHNKATCALANKLARICWAVWTKESEYQPITVA